MPSFHVNPHYANISEIVPGLFISGVCGLTAANLHNYRIDFVINATNEVPQLKTNDIHRIKLWLDDTEHTQISHHFDQVFIHISTKQLTSYHYDCLCECKV